MIHRLMAPASDRLMRVADHESAFGKNFRHGIRFTSNANSRRARAPQIKTLRDADPHHWLARSLLRIVGSIHEEFAT